MSFRWNIVLLALAAWLNVSAQQSQSGKATPDAAQKPAGLSAAAEDISGTYGFLHEGESLQLTLEQAAVSGYVVRRGDLESDRGSMLTHFFREAAVDGRDVSFVTRTVHGVWFEFKGRFERGTGKARAMDGYYLLKGELKEFITDGSGKSTARTRQVEFKWVGQR